MTEFPFSLYTPEQLIELATNETPYKTCEPWMRIAFSIARQVGILEYYVTYNDRWKDCDLDGHTPCVDVTYRFKRDAIPDDMRAKKVELNDCEINQYGKFTLNGTTRCWWQSIVPSLPGYRGVVYTWRGHTWCEDGHVMIRWRKAIEDPEWGQWIINPAVETPTPTHVRFLEKK